MSGSLLGLRVWEGMTGEGDDYTGFRILHVVKSAGEKKEMMDKSSISHNQLLLRTPPAGPLRPLVLNKNPCRIT